MTLLYGGAASLVILLALAWMVGVFVTSPGSADIQRACGSAGVAQIHTPGFWILTKGVLIVCRDGRVVRP